MNSLYLTLCLLFGIALSASCTRQDVLDWVNATVDLNHDGYVNVTEINRYILYDPCNSRPLRVVGESVIGFCDRNEDGLLSVEDYDDAMSCSNVEGIMRILCREVNKCSA